jgi:hypothetical protein
VTPPAFHLSFAVPDLRVAARFYCDVLGCAVVRDEGIWLDVSLYGHQLTLHQASTTQPARPLDHFGLVMDTSQWQSLAMRIERAGVAFDIAPHVVDADSPRARGKFLVRDPAGNLLEFKSRPCD